MATTSFKGIVKAVETSNYGEGANTGTRQSIIVFVPGYVNQFGEKKGADNIFQVDQFNDAIKENPISKEDIDRKIELEVWLSGRSYERKDQQGWGYSIGMRVKTMKLLEKAKVVAEADDDLPF